MIKFPVHQRRMSLFEAKPSGDSLTFLRELTEFARVADWKTFNQEAAVCHLFLNSVKCEEAKKACFKLLAKNPEGDIRKLVMALQSIEAYPDKEIAKVKPVVLREACGKCNIKGHAEKDCWGQCIHCKKFGHQSKFCKYRKIKNDEEIEAAKRAREDKKQKKKDKKEKKKRDEAKRDRELSNVVHL